MNAERQKLYRELLHRAMIDMRAHTSGPAHLSFLQRWREPSQTETLGFVNALNDWLHNVALYSAQNFESFNEEWFWRDYDAFRQQYPADKWALFTEGIAKRLR